MKGIIGAERAKSYTPSSYHEGDRGGSASGYGLPHGAAGGGGSGGGAASAGGFAPMYQGSGTSKGQGGISGGGVSEKETMPSMLPYPKKQGYDETNRAHTKEPGGSVHGVPNTEGLKESGGGKYKGEGHACGEHGCGHMAKTAHGLARHIHAKHGYSGLGHHLTHGTSYKAGQEFKGETEGPKEWAANEHEFQAAQAQRESEHSSYGRGDRDTVPGR